MSTAPISLPYRQIVQLARSCFTVALYAQNVIHFTTGQPFTTTVCGYSGELYSRALSPDLDYDVCSRCAACAVS